MKNKMRLLSAVKPGWMARLCMLAGPVSADEAYCFNAGIENSWDCGLSGTADVSLDHEYHTLEIILGKGQDGASLDLSDNVLGEAIKDSLGTPRPKGLIRLPDSLDHVLWVDLKEGNLHVLRREEGQLKLAETMSVSIGKNGYGKVQQGDKKTPVGVYRLLSYPNDEQLDDFYGNGAYTLNYPNAWDQIRQSNGSGIWLHGLPKGRDHRPLQDGDGCVVSSPMA